MKAFIFGRFGKIILSAVLLLTLTGAGFAQGKGGGGNGGGGGGGGAATGGGGNTKPVPPPDVPALPTTAPASDVIMRESFGLGGTWRPSGAKGTLKQYQLHTPITGFWVEYPGSKDTAWLAPADGQTWRVCQTSDNPYETLFTPLQGLGLAEGCMISDWFDPVTEKPTALMPFKAPATAYEISMNGHPAPIQGQYLGFGLTGSSLLDSNLQTSASVWLLLKPGPGAINSTSIIYELRVNGMDGPVLASGETFADWFSRIALRYDPVTKTVSASVNGIELGAFQQTIPSPKFIGIEGVGFADNFIVRKLQ